MSVGAEAGWLDWTNHKAWNRAGHHNFVIGHQACNLGACLGILYGEFQELLPVHMVKPNLLFPVTFPASCPREKLGVQMFLDKAQGGACFLDVVLVTWKSQIPWQ